MRKRNSGPKICCALFIVRSSIQELCSAAYAIAIPDSMGSSLTAKHAPLPHVRGFIHSPYRLAASQSPVATPETGTSGVISHRDPATVKWISERRLGF
jgi:hypothetical protein